MVLKYKIYFRTALRTRKHFGTIGTFPLYQDPTLLCQDPRHTISGPLPNIGTPCLYVRTGPERPEIGTIRENAQVEHMTSVCARAELL